MIFDYPAIRKFYFDKGAEKCANDPSGEGRFESAFYHTIKMVHDTTREQALAESAERIAGLEAENAALKQEHAAPLSEERYAAQAEGRHPAPCARFCEANAFEIEIRRLRSALNKPADQMAATSLPIIPQPQQETR